MFWSLLSKLVLKIVIIRKILIVTKRVLFWGLQILRELRDIEIIHLPGVLKFIFWSFYWTGVDSWNWKSFHRGRSLQVEFLRKNGLWIHKVLNLPSLSGLTSLRRFWIHAFYPLNVLLISSDLLIMLRDLLNDLFVKLFIILLFLRSCRGLYGHPNFGV